MINRNQNTTSDSEIKSVYKLLYEASKAITSEIDLQQVVQRVTDIGTELCRAQFGAFFYNVLNENGESFVLYTISGVPREAFSKFPMPRNTKIFHPTFSASGTVRYDDVTAHPDFGQNAPYYGMPKGHLPVKSYLAVPVISPFTKEAIGGLFFGHPDAGVFTQESEDLIEGIAVQAAIAITNARLFEDKKKTEVKLIQQREQYRSIFHATSDAVIIYDENGIIAEANPKACNVYGYPYEEFIGMYGGKLFKEAEDFQPLKEIALSGREYNGTNSRVKKDGTVIEVEFKGVRFIYKEKPHVLSISRDITSEIRKEQVLKQTENLAEVITSVSPVVLWMTNSLGQTIYINKTWLDWVGGSVENHTGVGWLDAILPEDRERTSELFMDAFAKRKVYSLDFRIKRKTGEIRWCLVNGSPYYNADGTFGGFAGSVTDTTERFLSEEKLASQNNLIQTITNNTQQALFLMDANQVCTYMNPAAEQMTGFKKEEVRDKPLHYYIHHTHPDGRHFPLEDCAIDRALPTRSNMQGEEVFIHRDGHFYPVAFTASPIIDNGVPIGTVIEVRDTTEEKRIQQELRNKEIEAMKMLEEKVSERTIELEKTNYELLQFTSVASHDLKEPVRKISIFSKMLKDQLPQLDGKGSKYLNAIISSSERMAQLIDDLLSFSRLSHSKIKMQPVDLSAVVQQVINDLELVIHEKQAIITFDKLPVVQGVAGQLGQLFQNLTSNSLKFCHAKRSPVIRISSENIMWEDKPATKIMYADNGIGFKSEQSEKIFEIFYRLHNKEQYEGTGVGLAIVKKIIDLHKGSIKANGNENEGAIFEIILPLQQQD